jgi:hypothetical protein
LQEKPLAGCVTGEVNGKPALASDVHGNDVRIILESLCEDVVDVVVARLGYSQAEVWRAIEERAPEYRPFSRQNEWDEEVRHLTAGGAVMLLRALGPFAFPSLGTAVEEFCSALHQLSERLNEQSHHQQNRPRDFAVVTETPSLILKVLEKVKGFFGELPWHMYVSSVFGDQPKVLIGEAWSHASSTPRLLRVSVWSGMYSGTHVLVWNTKARNPIMTDPVFIERPRRPKRFERQTPRAARAYRPR